MKTVLNRFRIFVDGKHCGSFPAIEHVGELLDLYGQEFEAGYRFEYYVKDGKSVVQAGECEVLPDMRVHVSPKAVSGKAVR